MKLSYEIPPLVLLALAASTPVVMSLVAVYFAYKFFYLPIFTTFTVATLSFAFSIWQMSKVPVKPRLKKILITIYTPIMASVIFYLTFPRSTHGGLGLF
tara:strand:- start:846 stop:1142 length:297 start_codon:yes stop_codon:yes gene_type:complete